MIYFMSFFSNIASEFNSSININIIVILHVRHVELPDHWHPAILSTGCNIDVTI